MVTMGIVVRFSKACVAYPGVWYELMFMYMLLYYMVVFLSNYCCVHTIMHGTIV